MATTIGVKLDETVRGRLKQAAERLGRTPHWIARQSILATLDRLERGEAPAFLSGDADAVAGAAEEAGRAHAGPQPFLAFARSVQPQSVLRARITAAWRRPETECLPLLIGEAALPEPAAAAARRVALGLAEALRGKSDSGVVERLLQEYSLSSQEGVALMCLAEALLRIPDRATRDALIRDKIGVGDWQAHLGHSRSLFVNAATWGLVVTGRLTGTSSESGLTSALTRLIGRGGEPLIRKGVDLAMRMMGEQFVTGQTISEALANSRRMEAKGFRHSYDMLGEAAMTAEDAERYRVSYEQAIHAIGKAAGRRGIYEGPGISIKLSALHPRYARAQRERVMAELLPVLKDLVLLARRYDIGLNIDAEEADRLELSLDLLEAICHDRDLAGWNGIGFVVQAYQKRAPFVLDWLIDLGRRTGRRLMVRLVKGAYWDSEIKRAQVDGLEGFPVFTRKVHTDVSFLACARRLLAAPDAIFPQFATHNAQTVAAIHAMAGANFYAGQYEFQCLHGMGEPLYEEVVGADGLARPCRIYAPVGTHETLLAYLVRRLLENGANTSFVHRLADPTVPLGELVADPVAAARAIEPVGAPHPKILSPRALYGAARANSAGLDLANEQRLASLAAALLAGGAEPWRAEPMLGDGPRPGPEHESLNPADLRDRIGTVAVATAETVDAALSQAVAAEPIWAATPPDDRAAALCRGADLLEAAMPRLIGLVVREAGKSLPNAVGEVREAVDFLRYYAGEARTFSNDTHRPLGPVACISPWNFPLAIFTGQVAAALAAGNPVLAKPAEETPLIAAAAVEILRESGVPAGALQLLPGDGEVGAALVADPRTQGVMFTGSTEVARLIRSRLAERLSPDGRTIPLVAETGGQNALIVDSSALAEQVVVDVLTSAFDSAGQRCSALRLLCLQEDVADRTLAMLKGALAELAVGDPAKLSTDVGPVIAAAARDGIEAHVERMGERGFAITRREPAAEAALGIFVPPTIVEIDRPGVLEREVFGPVLHVVRFRRAALDDLVAEINGLGYGLTFGVHSRIDETIDDLKARVAAGNVYVNRNLIGAVVGVQPFGGRGLSGTGPKAGGPLYLSRLLAVRPAAALPGGERPPAPAVLAFRDWLAGEAFHAQAERVGRLAAQGLAGFSCDLAGPVGERNVYSLEPRGTVLCLARDEAGVLVAVGAALATGNRALVEAGAADALARLPKALAAQVQTTTGWAEEAFDAVLFDGDGDGLAAVDRRLAERAGPIVAVHGLTHGPDGDPPLEWLIEERSVSTNTAAAGGNASLMTVG